MRCTGPLCQGTYCWRDPDNRKYCKLDTSVLTKLIDYAEEVTYSGPTEMCRRGSAS
ncbi:hypothetical protein B0H63DRAFT_471297 [Podospora didyma]|uniref:Uncharacterized protein n=1 Tax=Podospora didyma TaxID=330526 RepID=A0AAE0U1X3_9PEZI|nr:hypothetical protein B0H63DRAFT_471297 [Podospora didyma]